MNKYSVSFPFDYCTSENKIRESNIPCTFKMLQGETASGMGGYSDFTSTYWINVASEDVTTFTNFCKYHNACIL